VEKIYKTQKHKHMKAHLEKHVSHELYLNGMELS